MVGFSQFMLRSLSMNALTFALLLEFVDSQAQQQQHHDDYDNRSFLGFMGSSISSNNINDMIRDLGESDHTEHTTHSSSNSSSSSSSKPWGYVIGYTLLVNLVTFSGVILLALPSIRKDIKKKKMVKESMRLSALSNNNSNDDNDGVAVPCYEAQAQQDSKLLNLIIPSFATGALLSTVLFLILPESIMSLNNAHNEYVAEHEEHEHDQGNTRLLGHVGEIHEGEIDVSAVWKYGTAMLVGYLIPLLFEIFTHPKVVSSSSGLSPPSTASCACDNDIDDVKEKKDEEEEIILEENAASDGNLSVYDNTKKKKDESLVASIILGDFCHNFCDGVFIGVSFLFCSNSLAYTVVGVTIYHEVAQEMADFMLLTNILGLDVKKALMLNYLSGVSVIFGGILVLAVEISQMWIGLLLAISSGIYLFIACSECFPRAKSNMKTTKDIGVAIGAFLGGATPIGLTLMNHTHCAIHD